MNAALQEIDLAVIFKVVGREVVPPEAKVVHFSARVFALMNHVVNRQHARSRAEDGIVVMPKLEINRRKRSRPIMRMHDIRLEAGIAAQLKCGSREKSESPCVITVLPKIGIIVESVT